MTEEFRGEGGEGKEFFAEADSTVASGRMWVPH